jgi:prefoldin beta subunit
MELSKETEQKISQLQLYEQSMQNLLVQKQQFQSQLVEIESALSEIKESNETYKIVGNIMVATKKEDLKKDLESKKEMAEIRVKTFEKQEKTIKEKAETLQKEVMEKMGK